MILIVFTTTLSAEAETLATSIIEAKLAACVQILPPMTSIYVWEGKVQKDEESLLLIKTLPEKYSALEAFIKANHSYDVPEIVAVEAKEVSNSYLDWVSSIVRNRG